MMRSMFAGVSGLKAHQVRMDVIGNNIANVNSAGYKSSRATFQDMLSQTLRSATAPTAARGGSNPQQIGLGVQVGSVDVKHTQGNTQSTGYITDLAIEGEGFFILGQGDNRLYTRAGMFGLDNGTEGNLVSLLNGQRVLGYKADNDGVIDTNSALEPLFISASETITPRATDQVIFAGNLDNRYSTGEGVRRSIQIYDSRGREQTIIVDLTKSQENVWEWDANWLLISDSIPTHNNKIENNGNYIVFEEPGSFVLRSLDGEKVAESENGRSWTSVLTNDVLGPVFEFERALVAGSQVNAMADQGQLFLTTEHSLTHNLQFGEQTATVTGNVEGFLYANSMYHVIYDEQEGQFYLRDAAGTLVATSSDGAAWVLEGSPPGPTINLSNSLGDGDIVKTGSDLENLEVTYYTRSYTDKHATNARAIQFNHNGSYSGVNVNQVELDPEFADDLEVVLDFTAFTQYADTFTGKFMNQNGYTSGALESYAIDQNGVIIGSFSNGLTRALGQVALARFANPAGLQRAGSTMFVDTANSGEAQVGAAGTPGYGDIAPSSLEMSNVDLSEEFTEMIITQRGFQANSRIITTSDEMLQELVNLKR